MSLSSLNSFLLFLLAALSHTLTTCTFILNPFLFPRESTDPSVAQLFASFYSNSLSHSFWSQKVSICPLQRLFLFQVSHITLWIISTINMWVLDKLLMAIILSIFLQNAFLITHFLCDFHRSEVNMMPFSQTRSKFLAVEVIVSLCTIVHGLLGLFLFMSLSSPLSFSLSSPISFCISCFHPWLWKMMKLANHSRLSLYPISALYSPPSNRDKR